MRPIALTFILTFALLTLTRCGVSKELREERKSWNFSGWEQDFKDRALCLCVLQGLNNKGIQDSIVKYDKSFYNPLALAVFDSTINELLKSEVRKIQLDSINSIGRYPADLSSVLEGKRVMNHCTELYRSKRLDSLVKIEKKSWKQIQNIMDKVHEKTPTH
ncbi:hypothetical protein [Aridibaculum aurantiacum]|uniref:hypothetical protein n=1 Tax=Aridibaculum aurantiacum TaxID=2810307 RepID=UPI001A9624B0|nr:hypothetical protein [Aridibaculum aurantiacum]